jgi:hypothetical protein
LWWVVVEGGRWSFIGLSCCRRERREGKERKEKKRKKGVDQVGSAVAEVQEEKARKEGDSERKRKWK